MARTPTKKQSALLKELYSDEKISNKEKAKKAGYSPKYAKQAAHQAINTINVQSDITKRIAQTETELQLSFSGVVNRFLQIHDACTKQATLADYGNANRALENIADLLKYTTKETKTAIVTVNLETHKLIEKYRREF